MKFLWTVAGILVKNAANSLGFGLGDSAVEIWEAWNRESASEAEKRADVEAVAQLAPLEAGELAERIVLELAADQPQTVREKMVAVLTRVPDATRRSLRRPGDPSGTTLRPGTVLAGPDDIRGLLPTGLPRFQAGETPLGGVDLELVELLGVGGFGEVWKARNPFLDGVPPVALKFCTDQEAARTLRHEAGVLNQVMRQANHPGVVRLLRSYLRADPPCLEYEYVEGGDLAGVIRDWHRSGESSVELVNAAFLQLAEVVGFAHRLAPPVVHRDLKPANVLVQRTPEGALLLKVADFGIGSVAANQALGSLSAKPSWHLTALATGTCTPLYASPQQAAGRPADPRDDVFALGVLWFQMLTGQLSAGRPGGAVWKKKLAERGLGDGFVALLEACFEEEPDHRPGDAAELSARLRDLMTPSPGRTLRLWDRYTREEIPPVFGLEFSQAIWNVGFVRREKRLFLLVTLRKEGVEEKFQYQDRFLGPDRLQWQSQNRTRRESVDGEALSRHAELGYRVHLFVRATKKLKGKPVPFHYCGEVSFQGWEGEGPITIRWGLAHPLPPALRGLFEVPS